MARSRSFLARVVEYFKDNEKITGLTIDQCRDDSEQTHSWGVIFQALSSNGAILYASDKRINEAIKFYRKIILDPLPPRTSANMLEKFQAYIPKINSTGEATSLIAINPLGFFAAIDAELSRAAKLFARYNEVSSEPIEDLELPELRNARAQYAAAKALRFADRDIPAIAEMLDRVKHVEAQSERNVLLLKEAVQGEINSNRGIEKLRSERIDEIEAAVNGQISDLIETGKASIQDQITAYLLAQKASVKIARPVELWKSAAAMHRTRFMRGLLLLCLTLGAMSVAALYGLPALIEKLEFVKNGSAQTFNPATTLTLAVILGLIAAIGFVLKIAGRLITNSLTLAEDAEIRAALADTFLGLTVEDKDASSEARDKARTVMLAALFRPLPGHQQEEIQPATVLTLAQEWLGKKTAP